MKFGSVCSGIEAASVAWEPLGWSPAWFAEIEKFPSRVLAHHYPGVINHGDMNGLATRLVGVDRNIDVLVGGTPCQSFSVAGLRGGLADERGNLALEFARLADALRPRWVVWENVPGVLSIDGGRAFGSIVGVLVELGYGLAWRVLDARYFGVPQRRRRVFVVASLGGAAAAASVLFEPEGVRRHSEASTAPREETAGTLGSGPGRRGCAEGGDGFTRSNIGKVLNNQTPLVCFDETQVTHPENRSTARGDSAALTKTGRAPSIAYVLEPESGQGADLKARLASYAPALTRTSEAKQTDWRVRRLTPRECERLQGFPDDYTLLDESTADGPRYAALGNSMAVPVMRWIGARIAQVDNLLREAV